jgi:uncharacterized protein YjbI with pentapeptide repeats
MRFPLTGYAITHHNCNQAPQAPNLAEDREEVDLVCGKNLIHLLASNADEWNAFRGQHPGGVMLNRVCLADAQLANADLHLAFLLESNLQRSNLMRACLERAILRNSNLRGSDLRYAKIDGADLFAADLSGADLRDASLAATFLKGADLRGANLSTAQGLTAGQIVDALGDHDTQLPENLDRPASWTAGGSR